MDGNTSKLLFSREIDIKSALELRDSKNAQIGICANGSGVSSYTLHSFTCDYIGNFPVLTEGEYFAFLTSQHKVMESKF